MDKIKNNKVLVAMSGGVDSSVTLLKILQMGYDPIGITMKLWEYKNVGGNKLEDKYFIIELVKTESIQKGYEESE